MTGKHIRRQAGRIVRLVTIVLTVALAMATLAPAVAVAATGAPGAPTSVEAVAGPEEVTLTWSPPTSTGSSPITSYVITADPEGVSTSVPGTSLTTTLPLPPLSSPVSFTIAAENTSGTGPTATSNSILPGQPGAQYFSITPYRVCDTRPTSVSGLTDACTGKALGPGGVLPVTIAGIGPVPSDASAVVLNLTAASPTSGGYLTLYPTGATRPLASSINFRPGETVANQVEVPLGTGGAIDIYNFTGTTQVVVDVEGYAVTKPTAAGMLYNPITPYRVCDTRSISVSGLTDACTGNPPGPGGVLPVTIAGIGPVPSDASAVVLNLTVASPTTSGYLTVYPTGATRPLASGINFAKGETVANQVEVPLGTGGAIDIYNFTGTTQVVVDVEGYYEQVSTATTSSSTSEAGGSYLMPLTPYRVCDTRPTSVSGLSDACTGNPPGPGGTLTLSLAGVDGVPPLSSSAPAVAVVLNVTVADPTSSGYLTVYPGGATPPVASNLNFQRGETVANLVVARLGSNGTVNLYNFTGTSEVVVDLEGYEVGSTIVPPTTIILNQASQAALSSAAPPIALGSPASSTETLSFSGTPAQLAHLIPGDIIGTGNATATPGGYFGQVTAITSSSSGLVVTTSEVGLAQAFSSLDTSASQAVGQAQSAQIATAPHVEVVPQGSSSCGDISAGINLELIGTSLTNSSGSASGSASITASGCIGVSPILHADASVHWDWASPEPYVRVTAGVSEKANLTLSASAQVSAQASVTLASDELTPIPLAPELGIFLTPVISFNATLSGNISASVSYGVNESMTLTGTVTCAPGCSASHSFTHNWSGIAPKLTTSTQADITLTVGPELKLLIDGIIGPTFSVDPGLQLKINAAPPTTQSAGPWWALQGVVDFKAGIFFGFDLGPVNVTIANYNVTLLQVTIPLLHAAEITTTSLPAASPGSPYSKQLSASGGISPYSWSLGSGATLPSWLTLSSSGVLSGTPPASAKNTTVSIPVVLSDALGPSQTATLALVIGQPTTLKITTTSLSAATVGSAYSATLQATGGITPYSWAITSGSLPAGLSLDASTGVISGTPTTAGSTSFGVTVTDAQGAIAQGTVTITVSVSSATSTLIWSAPASIDPNDILTSVSCASSDFCIAVSNAGIALTWNGTSWSQSVLIDPNPNYSLTSVSCPSATFCVAVVSNGDALTWNGTSWSQPVSIDPNLNLDSVSCPSSTFCAAVDFNGNALTWNGTSWSTPVLIDPNLNPNGYLNSVSCPSATFCVAVDSWGNAITWNGTSWSQPVSIDPGDALHVSCPSATFCVAVGNNYSPDGVALSWNGTSWSTPFLIDNGYLTSVSCPSATFCVAVDDNGNAVIGRS